MNRVALALVLALSLPLVARADEASHRAKAEEMMTFVQTERTVQQTADNILKGVDDAADHVANPNGTPEQKAKVAEFKKQAAQMIDDQLSWKALKSGLTDIYVNNFTEEDLDAIIAFYKTPAGTALLTKMPAVDTQFRQLGQSRVVTIQPQLKQMFQDFQKSQAAAPKPPSPAAPAVVKPAAPATSTPK